MEEESVQVEETTEVSQPEVNTEETEAPIEETQEQSSEETENTAEEEPEQPKRESRATARIQQLIAENKALKAQQAARPKEQPQLEGVDESGIDPIRFAQSLKEQIKNETLSEAQMQQEFVKAQTQFPLVNESNLVRARAAELFDQGYTPTQAAEIASLEYEQSTETILSKSKLREEAGTKMRQGSQIPSAGKTNPEISFDEDTVSKMSLSEYAKYRDQILKENGIR